LESYTDSLIDVIDASTGVTVSIHLLINHDKATLLRHKDAFFGERRVEMLKNIRGARNRQILYVGHKIMRDEYEIYVFHVPPLEVGDKQKRRKRKTKRLTRNIEDTF
jgi:hypothetical protein